MNKRGETDIKDFCTLFLIYILLMANIASSANISMQDNPPSAPQEEPTQTNQEEPQEAITENEPTPKPEESTQEPETEPTSEPQNQTQPEPQNQTQEQNQTIPEISNQTVDHTNQTNQTTNKNESSTESAEPQTTQFTIEPQVNQTTSQENYTIELIQLPARVGEKVKWIKRTYNNRPQERQSQTFGITSQELEYTEEIIETPAPQKEEKTLTDKKEILIYSEEHYENVTATTQVPFNTTSKEALTLYWKEENKYLDFKTIDENNDSIIDQIEWIIPHLSNQTFELSINIINVQSFPVVGGEWKVQFQTQGKANLTISGINGTEFDEDLRFLELYCGENEVEYQKSNNQIFVENYQCNETSYETSRVITSGKHHLEFTFGIATGYAHNAANDFRVQRGYTILAAGSATATITAGVDYIAPTGEAFIRITSTRLSGMGRTSGGGNQNTDDFTVNIQNPNNLATSVNFERFGTANNDRVSWEIIEYTGPASGPNEFKVRQASTQTFTSTGLNATTSTISGIQNDNDIVVFITGQANPDTGRVDPNTGMHTSSWGSTTDTATFTRGEASADATKLSYAVIEFTGSNWKVQRSEHSYTAAGTTQYESISQVANLSRTFLHVQHRVGLGLDGLDEQGAEVYLSSTSTIAYQLVSGAGTTGQVSVAWIIENNESIGTPMNVQHISGTRAAGGLEEDIWTDTISIVAQLNTTSIMGETGTSTGTGTAYPRGFNTVQLLTTNTVELRQSDSGQAQYYRYSVVEWPTAPPIDFPQFSNPALSKTFIGASEVARFTLNITDPTSQIASANITIDGTNYSLTKGTGNEWYYNYTCTSSKIIDFTFTEASDNGPYQNYNSTTISGISLTCDADSPVLTFISPNTPENNTLVGSQSFPVNLTITETNFANITYSIFNQTSTISQTTYSTPIQNHIFTNLITGNYSYNVTAFDQAGQSGSTGTRTIRIFSSAPIISFSASALPNNSIVSGSAITSEVSVTEPNEANITFYLYDQNHTLARTPITYTDSRRSTTWTLLSDGKYFYNVTVFNIFHYSSSTETREITLDNQAPIINYELPTPQNNSYLKQNYIFINSSVTEPNFANITFYLYNKTSLLNQTTYTSPIYNINFTNLSDAEYFYNITTRDKANNIGYSITRKITLDNQAPIINFSSPTELNGTNVSRTWIFINTTINETNFANITFYLYDQASLINTTTLISQTHINFTNLPTGFYKYNVTAQDRAGNSGSSTTRIIGLDTTGPLISITSPQPKAYGNGTNIPLTYSVSDPIAKPHTCWYNIDNQANITTNCTGSSQFTVGDGSHTLYFFANDTFSNPAKSTVTFLVSTTGPAISLNQPANNTVYSTSTLTLFNYSVTDPDGVESCSLFGSWNNGWHLNQTDLSYSFLTNKTTKTCDTTWGFDCGVENNLESDNTFDTCQNNLQTDEKVNDIWLSATKTTTGSTLTVTCEFDTWSNDDLYIWYYNGTGWKNVFQELNVATGTVVLNKSTSFTVDNIVGTHWVRCGLTYNVATETDACSNTGSYYDNDDLNFTVVQAKESGNFTTQLSTEGNYNWNVQCNDSLSYVSTALNNFSIAIDLTNPIVNFTTGTLPDNSRVSDNKIFVNATVTESNPSNITFYLYNSSTLIQQTTYSTQTNITWNSLSDQTYYYNFTATDKAGRSSSSTTRSIILDTSAPTGTSDTPSDGYFTKNKIQNLTATFSDTLELKEVRLFIYNSTGNLIHSSIVSLVGLTSAVVGIVYEFLYDDVFSWFYQVKDSVNNSFNTTAHSIEIDSTAPTITFISPTELNDQIVLRDYITINTSIYEKNFQNITFYLFNDEGIFSPSPNSFSDNTRLINYTILPDDKYYYNVSSYDLAGNEGYSETRTITLDTTPPSLIFSGATLSNQTVIAGSTITAQVSVTEANEKNITFALYDETRTLAKPLSTFIDGRRLVTWNLLSEGTYFYNVTVVDKVEQKGSTETRVITLDNTLPIINFAYPTENPTANKSQNWVFINTTIAEANQANITFNIYNSSGLVASQLYADQTTFHNFTNLPDEIYAYNVTVVDKANQNASTSTRTITLDTIQPTISFISPTENTGVIRNRNWVFINTTTQQNLKEIIFNLYDSSGLINSTALTTQTNINFTNLPDENYLYNVTATDWSGNMGSTETRTIGLDGAGPIVEISKPKSKTYGYNESIPLEHTVSDFVSSVDSCWWNIDNGQNQSITCNIPTTFNTTVASHALYFFANDSFGNIGSDSVNFFISVTGPAIELINPINNTFLGTATVLNFSFAASDPDGTDTCSLHGDWIGVWHENQTYSGDWQDVGFKHRKDITISNTGSSTLTNFPIYLNIPSTYTDSGDYADLKFFNGSCAEGQSTQLPHEIENYNSTEASIWLNVPNIPTQGQIICLYYANDNPEDSTNSTGTWNTNYAMVYHMDLTGEDSTLNNRDKVADIGSPFSDDTFLGYGTAFSTGNAWSLANLAYWEAGYGTRTHEAVFETSSDISSRQVLFAEGGGTNGIMMYIYNDELYVRWWISAQDNYVSTPISPNTKYHAVMTYANPGNYSLYLNGELQGTGATTFSIGAHSGDGGIGYTGTTSKDFQDTYNIQGYYFTGSIFEFRASDTYQTLDQANQTYQTIFNQDSTISYQSEQNFTAFQIPMSEEGTYKWNVQCNDTIGYNSTAQNNYTFIVDVTEPQVFFGSNTENNNSNIGRNWIFVDANLIENNFKNITFNLYNQTGSNIKINTFTDSTRQINWTNLASGTYVYNITVYDRASHVGVSQTRTINLDLFPPTTQLNTPVNNSFLNNLTQNLTATFSDATGLLKATLYVLNATGQIIHTQVIELSGTLESTIGIIYNFLSEGIYSWFYQVEDIVGNKINTTANTLTIDTTSPSIDYTIGTESSGQIFERENIFVNTTTSDIHFKNITFNLFDSNSKIFSHTFTDNTRQINWTTLPDETYFYNATVYDLAGNSNSTPTRNITLDNLYPTISFSGSTLPSGAIISNDRISLSVIVTEANEANITFNLYNQTGSNIKTNIFTNPQRGLAWNLIPQGTYFYNVTVVDKLGHSASTTTRSITLDTSAPQITYGFGTLPNNTHINQNWIFVKATLTEEHFANITFNLYNQTGIQEQHVFADTTREFNFTSLTNANYQYDIISCDQASNCNTSQTRYITLDGVSPIINFELPTEINNFNKTQNWIFINTSINESNFANITFNLYDQVELINKTTYTSPIYNINFTDLSSKIYFYNVTTSDKAGNTNSTEERKIGIDYVGPSIQILSPQSKAYGYNESLPLTYMVTDAIVGSSTCWYNIDNQVNITIDCTSSTNFNISDGQHTLHFFANDTFNNMAYKNVTFLISTTGPAIQLIAPVDNSFYSQATEIFFNYTAEDPDLTESCSLYGTWNGGWHLNQTDNNWKFIQGGNYSETFETSFGNWTADGGSCTWIRDAGGTPSSGTGSGASPTTGFDHTLGTTAGYYIFTETSSNVCQGSDLQSIIESQNLDADTYKFNISFWFHMYGASMGDLHLDIYNGTWNNDEWTQFGQNQTAGTDPFIYVSKDLSKYSGIIRIRFRLDSVDGYTSDAIIDDMQISFVNSYNKPSGNFTLNLSKEGTSEWNILCNDTKGYITSAVLNNSITFDVTDPVVDFGLNTLPNNSNVSQNYIYINSSIIENNFQNMTFYLYNKTSLVATYFQNDTSRDHTFINLPDETYHYNITAYDFSSRKGNSPTRYATIDTTSPQANLNAPSTNTITNNATQNLTATLSDELGLSSAILYIFNQTELIYTQIIPLAGQLSTTVGILYEFLSDGIYRWFYQAEDIVGNKINSTNNTITIDTLPPRINFIPTTLANNTFITQNYIYINTSIQELNFKNITFNLFNEEGLYDSYTFTNTKRDINFTLLSDDEYFYNVTSADLANNSNTTQLQTINLDNIPPTANYISPTEIPTANKSQNYIYINTSISESNFANITFYLYQGTTPINITTYSTKTTHINFTGLTDGVYSYNATIFDKAGQSTSLPTRIITLDTTRPILFFIAPTQNSGAILEQESIVLNTSISESNFANITFYLYNETALLNQTTFYTPQTQINFSASGENKTYFYNTTIYDTAGNYNSTATRNITLIDTTYPTLNLISPQNKSYTYNTGLRINYNAYDLHIDACWYNLNYGPNITMTNCQSVTIDVADEQFHFLQVYTNDTLGYTTSQNVTFFVNSSMINLPEIYSVQRGSIFTDGTSIQPIEEIHPTKGFVLLTTRAGDSSPSTLQVVSEFTEPEEIIFKNYETGSGAVVDWSLIAGPDITVQRGEIQYTNEISLPLSISQVNLSNSFIIINNRLNSSSSSRNIDGFWTAKFTDDSNVNFTRSSNLAEGVLSYQIVSWDSVSVQSGSTKILNSAFGVQDTISGIDQNKTFMIFSSRSTDTLIQNAMPRGAIKDSTILEFNRTGSTGEINIEWFTITSPLFASQHKTHVHQVSSSPQYPSIPISLINTSRTFDIHSNENSGASTSFATAFLTQNIYNKTAIVLQKGVATGAGTTSLSVIEITELESPIVNLQYPISTQNFSTYTIPSFNFTVSDESAITNCSIYGNWSGSWQINQTILNPAKNTQLNFSSIIVDMDGYYKWNVICMDTYQNTAWGASNFTFSTFLPSTNPTILSINQTTNDGTGDIILLWAKSNHSTIYKIYSGTTLSNMQLIDSTTNENYTDSNFTGNVRRYYQIKSSNPISENSSEIFSAHTYTLKHNGVKSRNWISFPSNFTHLTTANETLKEINSITSFTMFNATTQIRTTCNEFSCPESLACTQTNCNFKINPGIGYEADVNLSSPQQTNWSATGKVYYPQTISLTKNTTSFGKNWIAIYPNTTLTNAQGLIGNIPNADALSKWNSATQSSQGLIPSPFPWIPGFIGTNFQLNPEEGYEVSVTISGEWTQS